MFHLTCLVQRLSEVQGHFVNPRLFSTIIVDYKRDYKSEEDMSGLLKWVHSHGPAVARLVILAGNPRMEVALSAFLSRYSASNMSACLKAA